MRNRQCVVFCVTSIVFFQILHTMSSQIKKIVLSQVGVDRDQSLFRKPAIWGGSRFYKIFKIYYKKYRLVCFLSICIYIYIYIISITAMIKNRRICLSYVKCFLLFISITVNRGFFWGKLTSPKFLSRIFLFLSTRISLSRNILFRKLQRKIHFGENFLTCRNFASILKKVLLGKK